MSTDRSVAMMRTFRRQAGMSLIELMVAITIGLFLLVGLVSVFATSNQTYMDLGRASAQIENGRFAMQILTDDIAHAGFYGRYSATPVMPASSDPCVNNNMASLLASTALPVRGYNNPAATPIVACLPAANFLAGPDILVVRRVDSTMAAGDETSIPNGKLTAGYIYMQANADSTAVPIIGVATGAQAADQATFSLKNKDTNYYAPIRRLHVHIYFIAPCSVPAGGGSVCTGGNDDNGSPIPTLKRIELTSNGTMTVVPLVEGIEHLQVDYGIDGNKDGVPDGPYVQDVPTFADWANVVAVRINVLSRQIEPTNGYVDSKTYDMGAAGMVAAAGLPLPASNFKRHVYNAVIRITNPASRRES